MKKSLAHMIACCAGVFLIGTSHAPAQSSRPGVGAIPYVTGGIHGVTFRVWAPNATSVTVAGSFNSWNMTNNPLVKESDGYWSTDVSPVDVGAQYKYVINNTLWKRDPRSLKVTSSSGESVVFDPEVYQWDIETFTPPERKDMVVYAMHVLTYNPGSTLYPYGTFGMAVSKLDHLQALGVNVVELMPIAEFPGNNSWGYNPTDMYSPESSYGGPLELQKFIDACHARKMAVVLDVVHNHWGPSELSTWQFDGYTPGADYGGIYHYNTDGLCDTPWGKTRPNYGTTAVRNFIKDNYVSWIENFRVDGFRTDSPYHMGYYDSGSEGWKLNGDGVSLMQDVNTLLHTYTNVLSIQENGEATWGFDCRWDMDFLDTIRGMVSETEDSNRDMYALAGEINNGSGMGRVVYVESHDTAGDLNGNIRLSKLIDASDPTSFWARKRSLLAAVAYMTSPGLPMVFQGEEMNESWSFSDHTGYRWDSTSSFYHSGHISAYKELIHARRNLKGGTAGLKGTGCDVYHVDNNNKVIAYKRWDAGGDDVVVVLNCGITAWSNNNYSIQFPSTGTWYLQFNSDGTNYYSDFDNIGYSSVVASGSPATANVNMGRYSALIYSKTAPSTAGTSQVAPCNGGCDTPLSVTYTPGNGPLASAGQIQLVGTYDNWETSFSTNMTRDTYNTNTWYVTPFDFPGGTVGMTYLFTDGYGIWDNNFSKDWYVAIGCHSTASFSPKEPTGCSVVTIRYEAGDGPLQTSTQVFAHVGQNNWERISDPDITMTSLGNGVWTCQYTILDPAYNLNVAFHDNRSNWDTHYNFNWNATVQSCHTNSGNMWMDPATPNGCDSITFYYEPATGPLAASTNINLFIGRNSWQDVVTLPMQQVSSRRWSLVFSPLRDSDWINFVFNDGQGKWDNNYTKDWHYSIYCPPQDGMVTYSPETPVGCEPITFTYEEEAYCPLEGATQVCMYIMSNDGVLFDALPMTEISNGYWQATLYPPSGIYWINFYFHDNQGAIDYQYKDSYWFLNLDRCNADGALAITNPATRWYAGGGNSSMTLRGSISGTTDQLTWTNTLTGQSGTISAESNWEIPNIGLQAGTNIITVSGRVFGKAASDSPTNAAYADGWQIGDNGGTGFGAWSQFDANPSISIAGTNVLGPKAWQFNNPGSWANYSVNRMLDAAMVPGDTLRFKGAMQIQNSLYWYLDLLTSSGSWLGSLSYTPYMANMITIFAQNYTTLSLPDSSLGLDFSVMLGSSSNAQLIIRSLKNSNAITSDISFYSSGGETLGKIGFTCLNYDGQSNSENIQITDLQVVPGTTGMILSDSVYIIAEPVQDQDTDGMPDDWEIENGLNAGSNDAWADFDGDGLANIQEFYAGTHPGNPHSLLRMEPITFSGSNIQLVWTGGSNVQQILQYSTNLLTGWQNLYTNNPPTPVTNQLLGPALPQTNQVFFRFKIIRP